VNTENEGTTTGRKQTHLRLI